MNGGINESEDSTDDVDNLEISIQRIEAEAARGGYFSNSNSDTIVDYNSESSVDIEICEMPGAMVYIKDKDGEDDVESILSDDSGDYIELGRVMDVP